MTASCRCFFYALFLPALCFLPRPVGAQEITSKTSVDSMGYRAVDVVDFYRKGVRILRVTPLNATARLFTVYFKNREIATLLFSDSATVKEVKLGDQLEQEISVGWIDRNRDGFDDYLVIATGTHPPTVLEAFQVSPEKGLIPVPSKFFETLLVPRAQAVQPDPAPETPQP